MDCRNIKFSRHGIVQMFARSITREQVNRVIKSGEVIVDYVDDKPFPSKLLLGFVEKRPIHVVVGFDKGNELCIVVTAYEPDEKIWNSDFKTRRNQ